MNPSPDNRPPGPLPIPPVKPAAPPLHLRPGTSGLSAAGAFEALLKRPGEAIYELTQGPRPGRMTGLVLAVMLICLTVFGLIVGSFSGGMQWWAAPLKLAGGVLFAGLLCLPSLYIFASLGGLEIRFIALTGLLAGALGLASLLLAGFAPVVWVFSQSSNSAVFMGTLVLVIWLISLWFGLSLLQRGAKALGLRGTGSLKLWMLIFTVVTLQVSTALRPIIGKADTFLPNEKKFFMQHWVESLSASPERGAGNRDALMD